VNGPRGGADDKRCRAVAEIVGRGRVVVVDAANEIVAAIDRTADRLGQAVRRGLDRHKH
jgi:hypothetical protein